MPLPHLISANVIARYTVAGLLLLCVGVVNARAGNLDTIGWTTLTSREPALDGSGVTLGQVEAKLSDIYWQASPTAANQSSLFTYFDSTNTYPTGAAYDSTLQSSHANIVADSYYDANSGVARSPYAIQEFTADYFYGSIIFPRTTITSKVVNQSYIYNTEDNAIDEDFDWYAASKGVLFVNGVNNGSSTIPTSPATMYNGIAVGLESGSSSTGPTADNRSKPDIVAPNTHTSYSTPYVAGSAALLVQAGTREDGGTGTATDAIDIRTLKALLLNGAQKPTNWTTLNDEPLDRTFGAGVLNVNRSHLQLSGGEHSPTETDTITEGSSITPPSGISDRIASTTGWNLAPISTGTSGSGRNRVNLNGIHNYHFTVTNAAYDLTATLVWIQQFGETYINNLDLNLYNYTTGTLVDESASTVDNVEHLYYENLPAGDYVLQVASFRTNSVADTENYALAFEFAEILPPSAPSLLTVSPSSDSTLDLTWTDNSDNEDEFLILRSSSAGGTFTQIDTVTQDTTSFTDSGLDADTTYYYRIVASNAGGDSTYATGDGTTYTMLEAWRFNYFGTTENTGDAADSFDYESDSLANLVEYGLGTDPTSGMGSEGNEASPTAAIEVNGANSYLTLTVIRASKKTDITYQVKVTGDLSIWTTDVTVMSDTETLLKVRDNTPATAARRFIRLEVTAP